MDHGKGDCEDGTGSRLCPMMGICINSDELSDSATRVIV
jgi:hypothetical protein